jgi:hypothetical protein
MHEFVESWKSFNSEAVPFVLPGDEALLTEPSIVCRTKGWADFVSDPDFDAPGNTRLHVDLLPMPFIGNLSNASVFMLMLNPGFGPHDYFGEFEVPEYRAALLSNLRQSGENSFLFLDPRFSWHGGYRYWHRKLQGVILALASQRGISYGLARQFVQSQIASIELVPYHSLKFAVPKRVSKKLESVRLAKAFVHSELLPKADSGECLVIVTRAVKSWGLTKNENVVLYSGSEARKADLGTRGRGGKAMLTFLLNAFS